MCIRDSSKAVENQTFDPFTLPGPRVNIGMKRSTPMHPYMSLSRGLTITALLVQCCSAQQDRPAAAQTNELWVLKDMMRQSNPETRLALLDQYRGDLQKAELIPWAYD